MARSLDREAMYAVVIDPLSGYDTGTPSGWMATNALMAAASDPRFAVTSLLGCHRRARRPHAVGLGWAGATAPTRADFGMQCCRVAELVRLICPRLVDALTLRERVDVRVPGMYPRHPFLFGGNFPNVKARYTQMRRQARLHETGIMGVLMRTKPTLAIVIPCFNEEETLPLSAPPVPCKT